MNYNVIIYNKCQCVESSTIVRQRADVISIFDVWVQYVYMDRKVMPFLTWCHFHVCVLANMAL